MALPTKARKDHDRSDVGQTVEHLPGFRPAARLQQRSDRSASGLCQLDQTGKHAKRITKAATGRRSVRGQREKPRPRSCLSRSPLADAPSDRYAPATRHNTPQWTGCITQANNRDFLPAVSTAAGFLADRAQAQAKAVCETGNIPRHRHHTGLHIDEDGMAWRSARNRTAIENGPASPI